MSDLFLESPWHNRVVVKMKQIHSLWNYLWYLVLPWPWPNWHISYNDHRVVDP